jgi:hypothetical protein
MVRNLSVGTDDVLGTIILFTLKKRLCFAQMRKMRGAVVSNCRGGQKTKDKSVRGGVVALCGALA